MKRTSKSNRPTNPPIRVRTALLLTALLAFPLFSLAQNATVSAPSFDVWDKFDYSVVQTFGARGFLGAGLGAGFGQLFDTPKEWGEGAEGYAKRYASSFGGNVSRQVMAFGLESTLHEDPRYFPSEDKGFKGRMKNVLRQSIFTKKDSGEWGLRMHGWVALSAPRSSRIPGSRRATIRPAMRCCAV